VPSSFGPFFELLMSRVFLTDLRHSVPALLARPGFTFAAVVTLALGIGANIAVFSVIEGMLLRPLPYPASERLVAIHNSYAQEETGTTVADFLDRAQADALADSALYYDYSFDLAEAGAPPQRLSGVVATPSLFTTLGVTPRIGRAFTDADTEPDGDRSVMWSPAQPVVLLSDALWRNAFGADENIVGREVRFSGRSYRLIGVMPPTFAFPRREVQLWLPFAFSDKQRSDAMRGFEFANSVGRLKAGATIAQLDAQFDAISAHQREIHAGVSGNGFWNLTRNGGFTGRARSLHQELVGDIGPLLLLLQAAVALVLAIACANVANLLLIRLSTRQRELAVRAALGASTARLASHVFAECLLLTAAGGAFGVALAYAGIAFIRAQGFDGAALGFSVGIDLPVLVFAMLALLLTAVAAAAVPLLSLRNAATSALTVGARAGIGSSTLRRRRNALVVIQQALAVALLVGAGLLAHSFWRLNSQDPGFDGTQLIGASINLSRDRYRDPAHTREFQQTLIAAMRALPGVQSAGLISSMPFSQDNDGGPYFIEGREQTTDVATGYMQTVDPGLFATMGIALLQGRDFALTDDEHAAPVAIIDEALARREFGAQSPLGRRIATRGVDKLEWRTIVGVVASVKRHGLGESTTQGTYYWPLRQSPGRIFRIAIRSELDAGAIAASLRAAMAQIDPEQPIWDVMPMRDRLAHSLAPQRTPLLLFLLFAGVALALSGIGVYGMLAFAVVQRTGEIGVRMSLGADRGAILRMVLADGGRLLAIGLAVGGVLAFALAWQLRSLLFGVDAVDPISLAAVFVLVAGAAFAASLAPALRAASTSPMEALRDE
jgi:predicted permease